MMVILHGGSVKDRRFPLISPLAFHEGSSPAFSRTPWAPGKKAVFARV